MGVLENSIREDLNSEAPRAMAILDPLKVIIDNYPENGVEEVEAKNHPQNPDMFLEQLRSKGIKTLYLQVGRSNTPAITYSPLL